MLTTLQKVKYYLDIDFSDTSEDWFLQELIAQVDDTIEMYCNRKFKKAIYTEEVKGYETLWAKNTPIHDVLELVSEDNEDISCRFTEDKILIKRNKNVTITGGVTPITPIIKSYFIVYEGGYETVPAVLSKVATEMVAIAFEEARNQTISVKNRSEGSVNQTFIDKVTIQDRHKDILDNYKIMHI